MSKVPASIGIILDGNRRWAKENGLPSFEGHRRGFEKTKEILEWADEAGIKEVVLYAFSTENWNRSEEEVSYLMGIFKHAFGEYLEEVLRKGKQLRFIGQRDRLPADLQQLMNDAEEKSKSGDRGVVAIALSYGGRPEILAAVNKLLAEGAKEVDEEQFRSAMWSAGLLDPDLIIRTGGEHRLSNFLTWQSVYSEFFFPNAKLPGFTREDFDAILAEYADRERRHGK
jgi:undecaprenyl diphosphate synthase